MWNNHLKIAWRQLTRRKGHALINLAGLAVGLAVCLLISMYVGYERSFDSFHADADRIFRIPVVWGSGQSRMQFAGSLPALAEAARNEIPGVERAGRVRADRDAVLKLQGHDVREENFFFVDPSILQIFSFRFLDGGPDRVLDEPLSLVISDRAARKFFGSARAVGRTLLYRDHPLKVNGVFRAFPAHTHLSFEVVASYATLAALGQKPDAPWNQWGDDLTYLELARNASAAPLAGKLRQLLKNHAGEWFASQMEFLVQPLSAIHWDGASRGDIGPKGNPLYVYLFSITALVILLVACFNSVNLTTARYLARLREVGVRKALGASRQQLVRQFLAESLLVAACAAGLSLVLFRLAYPAFYRLLGARVAFSASHLGFMAGVLAAMFLLVGIVTPLYPALFLSRFRPADAVRNLDHTQSKRFSFRQPLVVLQFAMSIVLIFGALVLFKQLGFMNRADLGFDRDNVALVSLPGMGPEVAGKYGVFRDELLNRTDIQSVSGAFTVPGLNSRMQMGVNRKLAPLEKPLTMQALPVDAGFVRTLGLKMSAGRDFSRDRAPDLRQGVILNQTAVSALGLKSPVGELLMVPESGALREVRVAGVVRDFHIQSLRQKIEPALLLLRPENCIVAAIRMAPGRDASALAAIRRAWVRVFGDAELEVRNLRSAVGQLYLPEQTGAQLLVVFMILVLIFCFVGLLGMASFVIGRQGKEIGVRKVLGASTGGLFRLLSFRLVKWIWVSCLIAWPLAYLLGRKWLAGFAYRTSLGPDVFLASGGAALLVALAAVSGQSWRAARANPVDSLHCE